MFGHKYLSTIILFMVAVQFKGLANGDPVITYSALTLSCTPQAIRIPEIKLVQENLEIQAFAKFAKVRVTYNLQNTSDKSFERIDYGFPVDWYGSGDVTISFKDWYTESEQEYGWKDSYVQDVHFRIDGSELSWTCSKDTVLVPGSKWYETMCREEWGDADSTEVDEIERYVEASLNAHMNNPEAVRMMDLCRKWYYTNFSFEPAQKRVLTVEYTIATNYSLSLSEKGNIFKNNQSGLFLGRSEFAYDFMPSSYWGDGTVENIGLTFDMSEMLSIEPDYVERNRVFLGDATFHSDFEMTDKGSGRWEGARQNYDLSSAAPMHVSYYGISKEHEDIAELKLRQIPNDEYSVTVNGKTATALNDGNIYTAAQIPPDDNGLYHIYIDFNKKRKVTGLLIYTGDNSVPGVYNKSKVPVEVSVDTKEHTDLMGYQRNRLGSYGRSPVSYSYQDLTDAAEKIMISSPSIYSYDSSWHYNYDVNHLDIQLTAEDGTAPYVSEIVLLGELPNETLYLEEEVDIKPSFGTSDTSLEEYINDNFSMLKKLRDDKSSFEVTFKLDCQGDITEHYCSYYGHHGDDYIEQEIFFLELSNALQQMISSMPAWKPANIDGQNVGCITSFEIK
ncbi:MAG: hypothetical protein Q4G10_05805 [Bacteroidia bacterium]|nr:hypothetical protein [Bacteroidia bacterium]